MLFRSTLVAEMGVGMRITKSYGDQLLDGIFNLMAEMGIFKRERIKNIREYVLMT